METFSKIKLYLLWVPYSLVLFCLPSPYRSIPGGATPSGSILLPMAMVGGSLILSVHYIFSFLRVYKGRKGTLHSLYHLLTYSVAIFVTGYLYAYMGKPVGKLGLGSLFIVIAYALFAMAFGIAIILSALLLFLRNITRKGQSFEKESSLIVE